MSSGKHKIWPLFPGKPPQKQSVGSQSGRGGTLPMQQNSQNGRGGTVPMRQDSQNGRGGTVLMPQDGQSTEGDTAVWSAKAAVQPDRFVRSERPSGYVLKIYMPNGIDSYAFSAAGQPFRLGSSPECECRIDSPLARGQVRIEPSLARLVVEMPGVAVAAKEEGSANRELSVGAALSLSSMPDFFLGDIEVKCQAKAVRRQ